MLGGIDGLCGITWGRPCQSGFSFCKRFALEVLEVRHAAGHRALDVEPVERGDPRPTFTQLHPRVRQIEALTRGASGQVQQQALT